MNNACTLTFFDEITAQDFEGIRMVSEIREEGFVGKANEIGTF